MCEQQRRLCSDGTLSMNYCVYATGVHSYLSGQPILSNPQRAQEFFVENLTGMNGGQFLGVARH